ncbi:hypothetical protein RCIA20 [Methanocella arvoryzae MRE50]|uniref:Uncharacterized protein n=1 Tax=Methanocella arvoryzae (strain DSM 22066 / NBRC 105507 / MRE50) TaxID=351160 RepID=Q0W6R6_METAR|nr:hypothetical protein RCIA20 [Methanocella arvoryzae MRE50]
MNLTISPRRSESSREVGEDFQAGRFGRVARFERRSGSVERSERMIFNIINPLRPPGASHNLSQTSLSSLTSHFESLPDLQVHPDLLAYLSVPP